MWRVLLWLQRIDLVFEGAFCGKADEVPGTAPSLSLRRLRIFGQRDKLKANRSKGA
jgi:hypothetical protein